MFCSASVQLALECLSIPNIASSPSTWIIQGTALPLSFSSSLWQDLKGSSRDLFTSPPLGGIKQADFRREKILCHKSPSGLSPGRYPSQGYLLYDTGKSLTIKSLVQSLGNNTAISLWQSTTNIRSSSKFTEKDPRCVMAGFLFYIFIS